MNMNGFSVGKVFAFPMAVIAVSLMTLAAGSPASAASKNNPFPKLKGNWKCVRGGCWVRPVGGQKERVGCRVRYGVLNGGTKLTQNIKCRGSVQMDANSSIRMKKRGRVAGSWTSYNNHTGRIKGGASGTVKSNRVFLGISSSKGYVGAISADIKGKRHTVRIYQTVNGKRHVVGLMKLRR